MELSVYCKVEQVHLWQFFVSLPYMKRIRQNAVENMEQSNGNQYRHSMKMEIPYDFLPPEQHFDSPAELLSAISEYQETRHPASGDERFNAPAGKFELLSDEEGKFILMPVARDYAFLFRGQKEFFPQCLPTLLREKRDADHMFLERMRIVEFELMVKQYPAVRFFEQENLAVDYTGLAQHYGLLTDVLDLTSDVRTALFFAMCDYDKARDCYHPKHEDKEYTAYLYAYPVINRIMEADARKAGDFLKKELRVIGMQPFTRPGAQCGYSFHVNGDNSFKGYLYSFSFTRKDSEDYYELMIDRRHIWNKDFISDKALRIRETDVFTGDALALTNKRYGDGGSLRNMQRRMNDIGIHFSGDVPWRISCKEAEYLNEIFENQQKSAILRQIVNRTVKSGDKSYPVMALSFLGHELMLQALQGGKPCVEGYLSGINMFLDDNKSVTGISFDMGRSQTLPDADGRITAFDGILHGAKAKTPEAINRRAAVKKQIDEAVRPFRMRRVFVPDNGDAPVYLDE